MMSCDWDPIRDSAVFNVKTKLGVSYDGGHWFHMAENLLAEHSANRNRNSLTNTSHIIYNFDKLSFVDQLNGITRLFTVLGTVLETINIQFVYFSHIPIILDIGNLEKGQTFKLQNSAMMKHQKIVLDSTVPLHDRFSSIDKRSINEEIMCVKFMGTIGGKWPTPQRGHWFPNNADVISMREKIDNLCPISAPRPRHVKAPVLIDAHELVLSPKSFWMANLTVIQRELKYSQQKIFKMVIYQRDLNRKIENLDTMMQRMKEYFPSSNWRIEVLMHTSNKSPCELYRSLHDADVLVTPHGFQSMLVLFLPPSAILFEVQYIQIVKLLFL